MLGLAPLAVTLEHALRAGQLPGTHKDPFDRILIAQAQAENLAIVSSEPIFDACGIRRVR
jgi:PIN domain nuclease of toxin-antitoxin system